MPSGGGSTHAPGTRGLHGGPHNCLSNAVPPAQGLVRRQFGDRWVGTGVREEAFQSVVDPAPEGALPVLGRLRTRMTTRWARPRTAPSSPSSSRCGAPGRTSTRSSGRPSNGSPGTTKIVFTPRSTTCRPTSTRKPSGEARSSPRSRLKQHHRTPRDPGWLTSARRREAVNDTGALRQTVSSPCCGSEQRQKLSATATALVG